ncbi:diguanylate cyclase (GGDEF) domain-containing protein [Cupriavidus sp. YR651]|uniref:GGDEF domain-containing protein n=1 Tax=Cupriavidus sp. YR651 TaxID=1855315 RepID=UPI000883135B|nr:GGDEF domain-containing protein [Cupriavidus sp. YR651]SDD82871.1 diguanylate cyclase (GGDEF) domain-containing protein [Cupriavidus sp. YR651]
MESAHKTFNPESPSEFAIDRLRVEFRNAKTELAFQRHHLDRSRSSLRLTLIFCSAFYLAFAMTDVAALGYEHVALILFVGRMLVAITAIMGLQLIRSQPEPLAGLRIAASAAEVIGMATFMLIVWFRSAEILLHGMSLCIMLIVVYLFIPNRLIVAKGIAVATTAAFILIAAYKGNLRSSEALTMTMLLLLANSFGIVAARRYHRLWRDEYRVLIDLKLLSIRDHLTGCYNRRHLHETLLPTVIAKARRHKQWLTLVVCDIDRFKSINDAHGHQAGDAVLQHVSALLQEMTRKHVDSVVRNGGEEFLLVLAQTDLDGALLVAERLRATIAGSPTIDGHGRNIATTASFGVLAVNFSAVEGDIADECLIAAADALLYEAKNSGRNSIRCREWPFKSVAQDVGSLPLSIFDSEVSDRYPRRVDCMDAP